MKKKTLSPTRRLPLGFVLLAFGLAVATTPARAARQHQHEHGDGPTVLRAARMLDVDAGEIRNDAVLVVEGGVITAVDPASTPVGAHEMDLGDVTLLPGLIDAHTHLAGQLGTQSFTDPVTRTEMYGAFNAVKYGGITLRAGFTTVRDFGGDVTVELAEAVERGDVAAPRVIPSRHPLGITGGHCDLTGFAPGVLEAGPERGIADGPWEVVKAVRYQIKHGAQVVKTCATAGVLSMEGPVGAQQYSEEELVAMVAEAARHGVKVAAHAHGSEGILAAVRAGVASIEHGSELTDEIMNLMIEKGVYLVPTTYLVDRIPLDDLPPLVRRKAEEVLPLARESVQKARRDVFFPPGLGHGEARGLRRRRCAVLDRSGQRMCERGRMAGSQRGRAGRGRGRAHGARSEGKRRMFFVAALMLDGPRARKGGRP